MPRCLSASGRSLIRSLSRLRLSLPRRGRLLVRRRIRCLLRRLLRIRPWRLALRRRRRRLRGRLVRAGTGLLRMRHAAPGNHGEQQGGAGTHRQKFHSFFHKGSPETGRANTGASRLPKKLPSCTPHHAGANAVFYRKELDQQGPLRQLIRCSNFLSLLPRTPERIQVSISLQPSS